jgi:hypothetical protein
VQRDVLALFDQIENKRFMRVELRAPRLALTPGLKPPRLTPAPVDRRERANRKPRCRRRADMPASIASTTRCRRYNPSARAITRLPESPRGLESRVKQRWKPPQHKTHNDSGYLEAALGNRKTELQVNAGQHLEVLQIPNQGHGRSDSLIKDLSIVHGGPLSESSHFKHLLRKQRNGTKSIRKVRAAISALRRYLTRAFFQAARV